jgi:hypothetical protein
MIASRPPDPLTPSALRFAAAACGLVLVASVIGAAVRLLPWVLDPTLPWATLAPFARSLAGVAIEAAILTGWPVGWALAAQRVCDRGEARVFATLGESPARTAARLVPQAAVFAVLLAATSASFGREAAAPGRIVNSLLGEGRAECAAAYEPSTLGVPFVSATWLCARGEARLVGRAPIGGVLFTAKEARVTDDLRRIDLDDARLAVAGGPIQAHVHVGTLTLHGLAPWARASALAPALRAVVVTASGLAAALAAVLVILHMTARQRRVNGVLAVALGAAGPLAALLALRGLELRVPDVAPGALGAAWIAGFALVPVAAVAAVILGGALAAVLPGAGRTGTK